MIFSHSIKRKMPSTYRAIKTIEVDPTNPSPGPNFFKCGPKIVKNTFSQYLRKHKLGTTWYLFYSIERKMPITYRPIRIVAVDPTKLATGPNVFKFGPNIVQTPFSQYLRKSKLRTK